jgi:acetylornithine deacetylase/succinyl-diaminopimelate desuccinylase-like protein
LELGVTLTRAGSPSAPVNIGLLRGGRSVNAIADHAELTVERRALDQSALMAFEQELERLAVPAPLDLGVEIVGRRPAGQLMRDAPLLRAVLRARAALALEERLETGSTDANAALSLEIPALALGVTRGRGMHTLTEEIALEPLALGAQQLELILLDLLVSDIRREPEKKAVIT